MNVAARKGRDIERLAAAHYIEQHSASGVLSRIYSDRTGQDYSPAVVPLLMRDDLSAREGTDGDARFLQKAADFLPVAAIEKGAFSCRRVILGARLRFFHMMTRLPYDSV